MFTFFLETSGNDDNLFDVKGIHIKIVHERSK